MSRQIKTIGIVGGLGPESTIEYYRQIIPDIVNKSATAVIRRSSFTAWTCENCSASVERMNFATVALSDRARVSWVEPDLKHFLKDVF
jgi:aspartate/glutamate racemase